MNNTEEVGCDSELFVYQIVYQVVYTYHVLIDCVINIINISVSHFYLGASPHSPFKKAGPKSPSRTVRRMVSYL